MIFATDIQTVYDTTTSYSSDRAAHPGVTLSRRIAQRFSTLYVAERIVHLTIKQGNALKDDASAATRNTADSIVLSLN